MSWATVLSDDNLAYNKRGRFAEHPELVEILDEFTDFLLSDKFEFPERKKKQTLEGWMIEVISTGFDKFVGNDEKTKVRAARYEQELLKSWKEE